MRGRNLFRLNDVRRALRMAKEAGVDISRVEILQDRIAIILKDDNAPREKTEARDRDVEPA